MTNSIQIAVRDGFWERFVEAFDQPVELGRQDALEPEPFTRIDTEVGPKIVMAPSSRVAISRRMLHISAVDDEEVLLSNRSSKVPIEFVDDSHPPLEPTTSRRMKLPVDVKIAEFVIAIAGAKQVDDSVEGFDWEIDAPNSSSVVDMASRTMSLENYQDEIPAEFLPWLKDAMRVCLNVFQSALNSNAFFEEGARAVVDIANMHSGQVLMREGNSWRQQACHLLDQRAVPNAPSKQILEKVLKESRTCWQLPQSEGSVRGSMVEISAVVAAPILDVNKNVIGVLYADRRMEHYGQRTSISKLEALLVEMLACGMATGLSRLEMEQAQVQYEQFFTPALAKRLIHEPNLLAGNDRPISVMFCDISGFSSISERLDPATTLSWIHEVLSEFSARVLDTGGVLVDYVGDELLAMWGAPDAAEDHAERACNAAIEIMRCLPDLDASWESTIGAPTSVCIGINSGMARVGNTGSRQKFKYGALGTTVNLASRVQNASKHLRTRLIIAEETCRLLPESFNRRRLCQVQVKGIATPVQLFELCGNCDSNWNALRVSYEEALQLAEAGELQQAITNLGNLLQSAPHDGPTLVLLSRLVEAMYQGLDEFETVWELPSK